MRTIFYSWVCQYHKTYNEHVVLYRNEFGHVVTVVVYENPDNRWLSGCEDGQNILKMALDTGLSVDEILLTNFDVNFVIFDYHVDVPAHDMKLYKDLRPVGFPTASERKCLCDFLTKITSN